MTKPHAADDANPAPVDSPKRGRLSAAAKMAMTAGSAGAMAALPSDADGAIVFVDGSPISIALGDFGPVTWDVDGAGGVDFELFGSTYGSVYTSFGSTFNTYSANIQLASQTSGGTPFNGRGLVGPTFFTDNVQALPEGFAVGPTLANGYVWGSGSVSGYRYRNVMSYTSVYGTTTQGSTFFTYSGPNIGYDFNYGFFEGENFFGFRFEDAAGDLLYGWAVIDIDTFNETVTIDRWAYESTPDTAIPVGAVPEPTAGALATLGMGAAGLLAHRRRRREEAEAAAE